MSRREEIFYKVLALVRNELWGEALTCEIASEEVEDILKMAREQAVSGLVANAIVRNHLPIGEDLTMEVCAIQKMHEKKNADMNAELALFAGFLNRRDLKYVIMKGQTMGALYPNPAMRSTGDIDFYCPEESFAKAQQAIEERLNIVMKHNASKKHDNFKINGYSFEMHSDITDFGYWGYQKYWDSFIDEEIKRSPTVVSINGENIKTLSPTLNALYIFLHAFYHLILNGNNMGLKQYCDWCMVMHCQHQDIDFEILKEHLKGLGLEKAFYAIGAFCVEMLWLKEQDLYFKIPIEYKTWPQKIVSNFHETKRLSEKVYKSKGVSFQHSMATLIIVAKQVRTYFSLAPIELFFRIPEMAVWSLKKRTFK